MCSSDLLAPVTVGLILASGYVLVRATDTTCVKPDLPGAFADSRRFERFNKEGKVYGECIKKYVEETKAFSDAYLEAGNKAIKDYNAFVAEVDERAAAKK